MAAGLPSARAPEAPPLWTEGSGRPGPGPGQQAMSRPRACLKTRASRQQMTLVEGSRRRLPRATAGPRCCTWVPWDPQFTSLFQVLGCSCLLERLPDAGAQPLPPSAPVLWCRFGACLRQNDPGTSWVALVPRTRALMDPLPPAAPLLEGRHDCRCSGRCWGQGQCLRGPQSPPARGRGLL